MNDFRVDVRELENGVNVLALRGVLDKTSSTQLEQVLRDSSAAGRLKFVVNCSQLENVSSDGMGVFLSHLIRIRKARGDIKFCEVGERVEGVLKTLNLNKLLVVKPTESAAIQEFGGGDADPTPSSRKLKKLSVERSSEGNATVLALQGFVDRHTIGQLDQELEACLAEAHANIVIDCADLSWISSNGVGVLFSYVSKARNVSGDIRLCCLRDVARTVITMLGLHKHFQVFETRQEAVASYA
ncbi:MAG: STAS domain-containing protein [Planctomycetota bacterium]